MSEIGTEAELVSTLYEAVGQADGWTTFINALARSYDGGKATLGIIDVAAQNSVLSAWGQWEPEQVALYNRYYGAINPWQPQASNIPVGVLMRSDELLPRSDLLKTEHYNDFLRPAQVDDGIAVNIQKNDFRYCAITVLFPQSTAERGSTAIGRLQRLAPHIMRVAQLNRQLAGLEARAAAAEAVLDRLATAMMVVNVRSRVVYMNAAAERVIAAGDGPTVARHMLDVVRPGEGKALRKLIASALHVTGDVAMAPGGVMRITRRSSAAPYEVLVAPISSATPGLGFDGPLAAVFVRDPAARVVSPTQRLQHLYRLTGAEARLMQALLAGDTLDTIAERIGVSRETLRSQLKAVCLKTGTNSQIELIRLGLRGLAAFEE